MLTLRPASTPEELARCLAVRRAVFVTEKGVPAQLEVDGDDRLNGPCLHVLIQVDGADAGALRLRRAGTAARLQRFCLLSSFRGRGWGRAAMAQVEALCRARGADKLTLDAKFEVQGFYAACGCRAVSEVFLEVNVPHVKMEKPLSGSG